MKTLHPVTIIKINFFIDLIDESLGYSVSIFNNTLTIIGDINLIEILKLAKVAGLQVESVNFSNNILEITVN